MKLGCQNIAFQIFTLVSKYKNVKDFEEEITGCIFDPITCLDF